MLTPRHDLGLPHLSLGGEGLGRPMKVAKPRQRLMIASFYQQSSGALQNNSEIWEALENWGISAGTRHTAERYALNTPPPVP